MVKLKNLQRRLRSFNLESPSFVSMEGKNGAGKPETLTMLPREVVTVPEAALGCAEIKSALKPKKGRPTLRVVG